MRSKLRGLADVGVAKLKWRTLMLRLDMLLDMLLLDMLLDMLLLGLASNKPFHRDIH